MPKKQKNRILREARDPQISLTESTELLSVLKDMYYNLSSPHIVFPK